MTEPAPKVATVTCIWCAHTETGEGYAPHDAILAHQVEAHGHRRRLRCGCTYEDGVWWTCDAHCSARIHQHVAWQIANYEAGRWTEPTVDPTQPSLLEVTP